MLGKMSKEICIDECLGLYDRMLWAGVRPNVYTFPRFFRTCGRVKDLGRGREVHVHVLSDTSVTRVTTIERHLHRETNHHRPRPPRQTPTKKVFQVLRRRKICLHPGDLLPPLETPLQRPKSCC
uniref:Pentatricopeptide repeat-containing protein At1g15510, chloroplastic n=1 Tax=Tanacetum cinerariifolium TaxID=118510 RepID=A0A6L2P485_TANCI|nr:pentatricopeptide repeat-containing protein At1g15510, chloroplastic [Tanacetum cinerariifolium]